MFLGQIAAKPSFLKYFLTKKWFHCSFTVSGRTARSSRRAGEEGAAATKTCLDTTMISRRVAHARTQRKHKHETRLPGWRCHKGLTPPTSDTLPYAQTLILVSLILVNLSGFLVMTSRGVGVTTWKFVRMFLLCLLYLPTPIRAHFIINRPQFFRPKVFKNKQQKRKQILIIFIDPFFGDPPGWWTRAP